MNVNVAENHKNVKTKMEMKKKMLPFLFETYTSDALKIVSNFYNISK